MVSSEVLAEIKRRAAQEWADDFEMQRYTVDEQVKAAETMRLFLLEFDQENPIVKACIHKALTDWPTDFVMQVHVFEGQLNAAKIFLPYFHPKMPSDLVERVKEKAFSEWPGDYEMMLHMLQKQVAAWEELYG